VSLAGGALAQQPQDSRAFNPKSKNDARTGGSDQLNTPTKSAKVPEHVTPKRAMSIRIEMFNFLRFEPVINTDVKTVPAYSYLESMWTQVLALSVTDKSTAKSLQGDDPGGRPLFLVALEGWRSDIAASIDTLKIMVDSAPTKVALFRRGHDADPRLFQPGKRPPQVSREAPKGHGAPHPGAIRPNRAEQQEEYIDATARLTAANQGRFAADKALAKAAGDLAAIDKDAHASKRRRRAPRRPETSGRRRWTSRWPSRHSASGRRPVRRDVDHVADQRSVLRPVALRRGARPPHRHRRIGLKAFTDRANECLVGRVKDMDAQPAGTIVTVTVRPKPLHDNNGKETRSYSRRSRSR